MMIDDAFFTVWRPRILSLLRIMAGLLFLEHGLAKLTGFPVPGPAEMSSLLVVAGIIEAVGGLLLTIGLFTRVAAFVSSGEMAVAYFMVHAPQGFFPIGNRGDGAILYCFIFLYLALAGGGPWSVDGYRKA